MDRVPYSEFVGSRVRLQRLRDQQIFAGWVQDLRDDLVTVASEDLLSVERDERFLFQVQGTDQDAYFIATCTRIQGAAQPSAQGAAALDVAGLPAYDYRFCPATEIQLRKAHQHARRAVTSVLASLRIGDGASDLLIVDASQTGLGAIGWRELAKGDIVEIRFESSGRNVSFNCEIRHCRPEPRLIGAYRLGLLFKHPDPASVSVWKQLFETTDR